MTTMSSLHSGEPGAHGSKHDSNPSKYIESGQVVVLIRLPHLPSTERSGSRMTEHAVPAPVVTETKIGIQPPPLGQGSSGKTEGSEWRFPPWFSAMVSLAADSKRRFPSAWGLVSDSKTAGFVVIMVLILSALLLPRGGTSPKTEVATHGLAEAQFPVVSMEVDPPLDSEEAKNSAAVSWASSREAAVKEPPTGESDSQASKNVVPKLEPMTPSGEAETGRDDPEPLAPAEVTPLTHPAAEPETPSTAEPATAAAEMKDPTSAQTPASDGATAQNDDVEPTEPLASASQVPAEDAWSQQNYPATEPSTYQYPSHYERLLSNALQGFHDENHPSSKQQSSIYGWQPSTVRLQPRIEPPPIR